MGLILLSVLGAVLGLWLFMRRQWFSAANQLGFSADASTMRGSVEGASITISKRMTGSRRSQSTQTIISCALCPAFDLGLQVTNHGQSSQDGQVDTGDPLFHSQFSIAADDPVRVRGLFTDEIRTLLRTCDKGTFLVLTDEKLIMTYHVMPWAGRIVRHVGAVGKLVAALQDQRRLLPPSADLEKAQQQWADVASSLGLTLQPSPLAMQGEIGGYPITCRVQRVDVARYKPVVTVRFPRYLGLGLRLVPRGMAPRGDTDFVENMVWVQHGNLNDQFEVASASPEQVKRLLTEKVCDTLVALARTGLVTVNDTSVTYEKAVGVDQAPTMIREVMDVATKLFAAQTALQSPGA